MHHYTGFLKININYISEALHAVRIQKLIIIIAIMIIIMIILYICKLHFTKVLLYCFTVVNHEGVCLFVFTSAVAAVSFPSASPHHWTKHCSSHETISTIMDVTLHEQVWKNLMALLIWMSRNGTKIKFPMRRALHHFQPTLSFDSYIYTVHYFFTRSKMFLFHSWIKLCMRI